MQKFRIASFIAVHVLIFGHIFWWGDDVIGSLDFQEFFHAFLKHGVLNAGTVMVLIILFTTLLFGRFFCGWACHFGAVQEFSWWLLQKLKITPKTVNSRLVALLPLFILFQFYLIPNILHAIDEPWQEITISLAQPGIWAFLPGLVIGTLTFFIDGFLIVYVMGRKGFCRFICPWGAFMKLPAALAPFKIRNGGGCIQSGNCTRDCPIGIDVSYEINNLDKVINTNCTNCMVCTEGCPSQALSYSFQNPLTEKLSLSDYFHGKNQHKLGSIKDRFVSLRAHDLIFVPMVLIFGFSIDGLYGMGHFLSFGFAVISTYLVLQSIQKNKVFKIIGGLIIGVFLWHGSIKYAIHTGLKAVENGDYHKAVSHLEYAVKMYPKEIGRFHLLLGKSYLEMGETEIARKHAEMANRINPNHESVKQLMGEISLYSRD